MYLELIFYFSCMYFTGIGSMCTEDNDCRDENMKCINTHEINQCMCSNNTFLIKNKCVKMEGT